MRGGAEEGNGPVRVARPVVVVDIWQCCIHKLHGVNEMQFFVVTFPPRVVSFHFSFSYFYPELALLVGTRHRIRNLVLTQLDAWIINAT